MSVHHAAKGKTLRAAAPAAADAKPAVSPLGNKPKPSAPRPLAAKPKAEAKPSVGPLGNKPKPAAAPKPLVPKPAAPKPAAPKPKPAPVKVEVGRRQS